MYRYINDISSINNPDFENYLGQMYPAGLEIKDTTESNISASFLDLLLSIEGGGGGRLRTSLNDKAIFHLLRAMAFFTSLFIRYARACPSYKCFILMSFRKFYGRYEDLIKQYKVSLSKSMTFWIMIIFCDTLAYISLNRYLVTELDLIIDFDHITKLREVSIEHLQLVRLANRGCFLLRTPGPLSFVTCICSHVDNILYWTCRFSGLWMSKIPRYIVLLCCFLKFSFNRE